eukprot:TRINITY_DN28139_c0_g1_i1.p1 TRINITY_DN28139_c0_g1~~TRINITY_DN28139_c0_g1_i1.p1  ORF type:complete len:626 (-),score=104.15 TRINITY_DN28139_c0_g1_i1:488-2365(-)
MSDSQHACRGSRGTFASTGGVAGQPQITPAVQMLFEAADKGQKWAAPAYKRGPEPGAVPTPVWGGGCALVGGEGDEWGCWPFEAHVTGEVMAEGEDGEDDEVEIELVAVSSSALRPPEPRGGRGRGSGRGKGESGTGSRGGSGGACVAAGGRRRRGGRGVNGGMSHEKEVASRGLAATDLEAQLVEAAGRVEAPSDATRLKADSEGLLQLIRNQSSGWAASKGNVGTSGDGQTYWQTSSAQRSRSAAPRSMGTGSSGWSTGAHRPPPSPPGQLHDWFAATAAADGVDLAGSVGWPGAVSTGFSDGETQEVVVHDGGGRRHKDAGARQRRTSAPPPRVRGGHRGRSMSPPRRPVPVSGTDDVSRSRVAKVPIPPKALRRKVATAEHNGDAFINGKLRDDDDPRNPLRRGNNKADGEHAAASWISEQPSTNPHAGVPTCVAASTLPQKVAAGVTAGGLGAGLLSVPWLTSGVAPPSSKGGGTNASNWNNSWSSPAAEADQTRPIFPKSVSGISQAVRGRTGGRADEPLSSPQMAPATSSASPLALAVAASAAASASGIPKSMCGISQEILIKRLVESPPVEPCSRAAAATTPTATRPSVRPGAGSGIRTGGVRSSGYGGYSRSWARD